MVFIAAPDASNPQDEDHDNIYDVTIGVLNYNSPQAVTYHTYHVAVQSPNTPPSVTDQTVATNEDTATGAIAIGATDPDGQALSYSVASDAGPQHGAVTIDQAAGTYTYTPAPNYNGTDSFTLLVSDGVASVQQHITVNIAPVNDAPVLAGLDLAAPYVYRGYIDHDMTVSDVENDAADWRGAQLILSRVGGAGTAASDSFGFNFTDLAGYSIGPQGGYVSGDGMFASVQIVAGRMTLRFGTSVTGTAQGNPPTTAFVNHVLEAMTFGNTTLLPGDQVTMQVQIFDGPATLLTRLSTSGNITLTVPGTANHVPVFDAASPAIGDEDTSIVGSVHATDSDGDALTYSVAQTGPGAAQHGTVTIDAVSGAYAYTPAANYFGADSFTVTVSDGHGGSSVQTVSVTINSVNDAAVLSSDDVAVAETDAPISTSGTLTISDVDNPAQFVAQSGVAGIYGSFSIDSLGAWSYVANAAFDNLNVGQSVSDTFSVAAVDGTTTTVRVTINGINDGPVVTGPVTANATEDGAAVTLNALANARDVDSATLTAVVSGALPAGVTFDSVAGTFTIDPTNAAYQHLAAGATALVGIDYAVTDGSASTAAQASFLVTGVNDRALIGGQTSGSVTEDATLTATGALTISDVDDNQSSFAAGTFTSAYGSLALTASGTWTYTLNNALGAVQALTAGQTLTDTVTVQSVDGTQQAIAITINGADETSPNNVINGTARGERLYGTSRADTINGLAGNDRIFGQNGADTINGGAGNDIIDGGSGNDIISGGAGIDRVFGGLGADTFVYRNGDLNLAGRFASDVIADFSAQQGDRIDVSGIDARSDLAGDQAFQILFGTANSANAAYAASHAGYLFVDTTYAVFGSYLIEMNVNSSRGFDQSLSVFASNSGLHTGDFIL